MINLKGEEQSQIGSGGMLQEERSGSFLGAGDLKFLEFFYEGGAVES